MAKFPEWARDLIKGTPKYPRATKKGEEFDPRDVPVFQGLGGRFYDPSYGREDLRLMAQRGWSDVPHLAGGETDFWNRFTSGGGGQNYTTWGSTFGGRGDVPLANQPFRYGQYPGQSALTEHGTNYASFPASAYEGGYVIPGQWYQVTNPDTGNSTWVQALDQGPGTSGGEAKRGIDLSPAAAKQIGYTGSGRLSTNFRAAGGSQNAGVAPATPRARGPYRDLSTPVGPLGMGTRFFETPESEFPRATPAPSIIPTGEPNVLSGGEVPQGQVSQPTFTRGGVEYAPTTNPSNPGFVALSGPNQGQTVSQLPGGSNNPLDYLNPFGGTTRGGSGTGVPTQKAVGTAVGTISNLLLPGSGFLTGPLARWVTHLVQGGMSNQQAVQVAQQKVAQGEVPPMPSGSVSLPTHGGGGFNMPGFGNMFSGLPEGFTEGNRFGQGAPNFYGPQGALAGPQWGGGSIFNANLPGGRATPIAGAFQGLGGMGTTANIGALGGGAVARQAMNRFIRQGGYLAPTQALVGGPPPGSVPGATMAGGYSAPIVNPSALFQGSSAQRSIHLRPMATQ